MGSEMCIRDSLYGMQNTRGVTMEMMKNHGLTLNKENKKSIKIYDLLNGMSEAVNSLWKFEILERANKDTCDDELQVVDLNFTSDGKVPAPLFKHAGADSFFISSDLSIDIPGEMMNSIVSDRLAGVDTQEDIHPTRKRGGLYSDRDDLVLQKMNEKEAVEEDTKPPGQPKEDSEELAAALYDSFLGKIGSYPKIKSGKIGLDGGLNDYVQGRTPSTLVEALQFPIFEDKALLTQKMAPAFGDQNKMTNPSGVPLPITYTFTVHGVSGIVHGDTFNVCLLYTSPSPRDLSTSRMPSSA